MLDRWNSIHRGSSPTYYLYVTCVACVRTRASISWLACHVYRATTTSVASAPPPGARRRGARSIVVSGQDVAARIDRWRGFMGRVRAEYARVASSIIRISIHLPIRLYLYPVSGGRKPSTATGPPGPAVVCCLTFEFKRLGDHEIK